MGSIKKAGDSVRKVLSKKLKVYGHLLRVESIEVCEK